MINHHKSPGKLQNKKKTKIREHMHGEEEKQVTPQMHCNTRLPLMFQTQPCWNSEGIYFWHSAI